MQSLHTRGAAALSSSRTRVVARAGLSAVAPAPVNWQNRSVKHVVDSREFDQRALDLVFAEALKMEEVRPQSDMSRVLNGCIMSTLFYEPSTRTRLSFESAMARLGGTVISTESAGEYSSAAKGETLEDTIRTVEGYADCIVLRHFQEGSAQRAANVAAIPIINAGDGPGQHPTQALLDAYTIKREIGRLDNVKIGFIGDLANGRTVRSLCLLMTQYSNVEFVFVAPPAVKMRDDIKELLTAKGFSWYETEDLKEVASSVDVLYQTRIQKERFSDMAVYNATKGQYIIDKAVMDTMNPHGVVLHPLPRVDEIHPDVDSDPRAAYFRQARNGLFVRMALLKLCLVGSQ